MSVKIKTTKIGRQKTSAPVSKTKHQGAEWQRLLLDFSKLMILIFAIIFLFGVHAYFNSEIQHTIDQVNSLKREITYLDKEIENHHAKIETLKSGEHIKKQITKFNLKLQLPNHNQRYEITLQTTPGTRNPKKYTSRSVGQNSEKNSEYLAIK